jgi:hypothetical protein
MTCREFVEAAESLTPVQLRLMQNEDEVALAHARECATCGEWLQSQKLLGGALQVLRTDTAQCEAGPQVEQAVLRAFRMQGFEPAVDERPERAAPAAWKLSRFFELGAYAAVAAALIVGIFLGARVWRDRQSTPVRAQLPAATVVQPDNSEKTALNGNSKPSDGGQLEMARGSANGATAKSVVSSAKRPHGVREVATAAAVDRQGFVALMFCDPLICSGEEEVIRMELPGSASSADGSQPVVADVIVGEDGLVRAMRIVN